MHLRGVEKSLKLRHFELETCTDAEPDVKPRLTSAPWSDPVSAQTCEPFKPQIFMKIQADNCKPPPPKKEEEEEEEVNQSGGETAPHETYITLEVIASVCSPRAALKKPHEERSLL